MKRHQKLALEIEELNTKVCAIHDEVDAKQEGTPTADQIAEVKRLNKEIEEKEKELADCEDFATAKANAEARKEAAKSAATPHVHSDGTSAIDPRILRKTIGDQVLEDPQFKAWLETVAPKGRVPSKDASLNSPSVELKTLITGASSTSGGAFVVTDRKPIVDQGVSYRELTLFDLITMGQTGSDTVDYVREGTHTNAADTVAEATATGDGTGTKPESAMALSVVTETVKTIAHWIPATRRALADAPQLRTLIDNFLRYGVMEELEDQIITGNAVGEDFTGLLNVSGTTSQAFDTDLLTTTRKARTLVKTTGKARPTGYVMNPADWETIDLLTDNENRYYFGGPSVIGTPRLWGLPVVECEGMTVGTSMCAPWQMAILWDREQANILISDSHSDFFIRNLVAILCEMRAAFTVQRPAAFVEIAHS